MSELLGVVVADRYELTGILGHGGQGVVYRARDRTAGREVAIKMLSDSVADDPVYAARLAREQEALVALAGTSAVAVYDLCEAPNGSLCLVMELLEGTDLETHLSELEERKERLPLQRLNAIVAPIVETLERAHDVGIIHRDLKPGNIFILRDSQGVRLFDFGLSRSKKALRLTQAGTVMGSPSYIAPEVWKGDSDALDGRVDVYALGVILFRALSGRLPFVGRTLKESFELASNAERPSLHALRPDLSPRVDAWVAQALAIDRDRRYQTARGLWNGLLKTLEYQPPPETIRPVAESLVGAWRAATFAFRKLVERATAAIPAHRPSTSPPESLMPKAEEVKAVDEGWIELTDEDEVKTAVKRPKARTAPPPRRRPTAAPSAAPAPETPTDAAVTTVAATAASPTTAAEPPAPSAPSRKKRNKKEKRRGRAAKGARGKKSPAPQKK
ncbi:MAG TPA: serine/threonine-protein kinase [Polyangiaceae bacterium]|nr:serine/threonine-protein kinase [Polyangiaceae bacterium]